MIFITTGTQLPFDRLVKIVDAWVLQKNITTNVVAQVGRSDFTSSSMTIHQSLQPHDFDKYFNESDLIISHAGMGSILTALKAMKPIIIFPRHADLGEHRNDHQLATAKSFDNVPGIYVARNELELLKLLKRRDELTPGNLINSSQYTELLNNLRDIFNKK